MWTRVKRYAALSSVLVLLLMSASLTFAAPAVSDESEVRGVVQSVFEQLKSGQYGDLYDLLPNASRARISRERFTSMLQRTRNMYELERIDIGMVRTSGDLAVVDTVFYGRVLQPIQSEGKIVAQQYLVREDGKWRVATGDRATVKRFLASNPRFAQKFPVRQPRIYIKRDGQWLDISALAAGARRKNR
ncbi:MAG TPA: hypothetical protein VGO91_16370 [Pyrinomonadaceae bacterium]|nr:hypothetical protein [Pyrinomonadaceae bacterium]